MRSNKEEYYEEWCERARIYEYEIAKNKTTKNYDIEIILEEMTSRLLSKMLHPLFDMIKDDNLKNYDGDKSRAEYKKLYLDKVGPVADHIQLDS